MSCGRKCRSVKVGTHPDVGNERLMHTRVAATVGRAHAVSLVDPSVPAGVSRGCGLPRPPTRSSRARRSAVRRAAMTGPGRPHARPADVRLVPPADLGHLGHGARPDPNPVLTCVPRGVPGRDDAGHECRRARPPVGVARHATDWLLLPKMRRAMVATLAEPLTGTVEADEAWFGGRREAEKRRRRYGVSALMVLALAEAQDGQVRLVRSTTTGPRRSWMRSERTSPPAHQS